MVTLAQIKAWFETGDIPTEAQYDSTWDSFIHLEDEVVEVFDFADISSGFADVAETLPDPGTKTDAQIWKAVKVYEGRGTLFPLDYGVPMGYRINTALNNIELINKDGHPSQMRTPPNGTRLVVIINKKFV